MARREPKSGVVIRLQIVGKDSARKGSFEITSGNLAYTRANGKSEALRVTHQKLGEILEAYIEREAFNERRVRMPKASESGDFCLHIQQYGKGDDEHPDFDFKKHLSLNQLDRSDLWCGNVQFGTGTGIEVGAGRRKPVTQWWAQLSVQLAIHVVEQYIDKFVVERNATHTTDRDLVVSKRNMQNIIRRWCKVLKIP